MLLGGEFSTWLSWLPYLSIGILPLAMVCGLASTTDFILLFCLVLFRNWKAAYRILQLYDLRIDFRMLGAILIVPAFAQIARWFTMRPETNIKQSAEGPKPLFFPSRTTHTRLFPKKHSFSYSYLLVGIPVGWQGSVGGMLSADQGTHSTRGGSESGSSGKGWFTVDAGDYLDRGNRQHGLDGKLRKFIRSQGFCAEDYPYAYFITAPKFLGYSFNPVSFWYLYSADRELSAMVVEVNNTFDERHMYFVKPSDVSSDESHQPDAEGSPLADLPTQGNSSPAPVLVDLPQKPTRFTNSWAKEFHVSPFNSRKGTYSLIAYDPLYPLMRGRGSVDNTATLKSSKAHTKLVARIFSEGVSVDPQTMSALQKLRFLLSWWWVGLVTYPRIVREAVKLFFGRKLHVWFRPEPLKTSMGRYADATEQVLAASFRDYLRYLVKTSASPLIVTYTAAGLRDTSEETMISEAANDIGDGSKTLELRVLTPVFYSRFVHYAHDLEAFFSEFHESGTIWLSQASLLPELVLKKPRPPHSIPSLVDYFSFKAIQSLRRRPAPIEGPTTTSGMAKQTIVERKADIRIFRPSAMDEYILIESTVPEQRNYRAEVLKLFISDRVALGNVGLLKVEIFILKFLVAWALVWNFSFSQAAQSGAGE